MDFQRGRQNNFDNTAFKQLSMVFSGKLLACLAKLNASHYVRYSATCFSLKTSTKAGYFSFYLARSFYLCRQG